MRSVGVGVIGCGEMAHIHLRCLSLVPEVRMLAAYDRNPDAARALVNEYGGVACPDLEAFLDTPGLDAVYVLTRTNAHREIAIACLERGKHVFCEKPMALKIEDTVAIYKAARKSGACFMVGYNLRRTPGVEHIMGELMHNRGNNKILVNMSMAYAPFMDNWLGQPDQGGGAVVALGSHAFDLLRYIVNADVAEICCYGAHLRLGDGFAEDAGAAVIRFVDGSLATVLFHDNATPSYAYDLGRGLLKVEVFAGRSMSARATTDVAVYDRDCVETHSFEPYERLRSWGYVAEDRHFVQSILLGDRPVPDETDGLWAAILIEAARRSIDSRAAVDVGELAARLSVDLSFDI